MYNYESEKPTIFTDSGQRMFLAIRDHVNRVLEQSGAVTMGKAIDAKTGGDSWSMLACVDRLVELGELREIKHGECSGQETHIRKGSGMSIIIGLDIAQTTTGMARLTPCPSGATTPLVQWSTVTASKGKGFYDDQERAGKTLSAIAKWSDIGETVPVGMLVVCEDFSFGSQMAGTRSVAMVTGLIRYWLWKHKVPFALVSPQSLKKFLVGRASHKGDKIGKEIVNRELFRQFGHSVDDNNAADAVGLAYIGAALNGIWTPQNEAQRDVLKKIKIEGVRGGS